MSETQIAGRNYTREKRGVFFLIDSKSFYASVETVERGLNPLQSEQVPLECSISKKQFIN